MLSKRLIVCLDVRDGKVTKGVQFKGNVEVGEPVAMAEEYYRQGVDELVFYDITASAEGRPIDIEMVREVARRIFIPFSVGGGIRNLDDMRQVLLAGAEKVSVNSLAVREPAIISDGARAFGNQCMVIAIDARCIRPDDAPAAPNFLPDGHPGKTELALGPNSTWQVVVHGGRTPTGIDVLKWARHTASLGAGEILLTSMDTDGHVDGYDLELTRAVSDAVSIPVIASGGAGSPAHMADALSSGPDGGHADAALRRAHDWLHRKADAFEVLASICVMCKVDDLDKSNEAATLCATASGVSRCPLPTTSTSSEITRSASATSAGSPASETALPRTWMSAASKRSRARRFSSEDPSRPMTRSGGTVMLLRTDSEAAFVSRGVTWSFLPASWVLGRVSPV